MSNKKYDLSQVSQATKDAYLQASIDFDCNRNIAASVRREAAQALYREAEVKPKTARGILQEYLDRPLEVDRGDELEIALEAIEQAVEALT